MTVDLARYPEGSVRIRHTEITVWSLAHMVNQGLTNEQIHKSLPALPKGAMKTARDYYLVHPDIIDAEILKHHGEEGTKSEEKAA